MSLSCFKLSKVSHCILKTKTHPPYHGLQGTIQYGLCILHQPHVESLPCFKYLRSSKRPSSFPVWDLAYAPPKKLFISFLLGLTLQVSLNITSSERLIMIPPPNLIQDSLYSKHTPDSPS